MTEFETLDGHARFVEESVESLDLSEVDQFIELLCKLCGQDSRPRCQSPRDDDKRCGNCGDCINLTLMEQLLRENGPWDHTRLNQALLLVNQPTVSGDFYDLFFGTAGTRDGLKQGVANFRGMAMLAYGNFRFAYKRLAPMSGLELRNHALSSYLRSPEDLKRSYSSRPTREPMIQPIEPSKRWHLGYLSGRRLDRDNASIRAILSLRGALREEEVEQELTEEDSIGLFRGRLRELSEQDVSQWNDEVVSTIRDDLKSMESEVVDVQGKGWTNTIEYLTSEYLDVYVDTSMREPWEYESTAAFLSQLTGRREIGELHVRFFDPTLSFLKNRIDKGLVEGLMLRRAECTLYMVQETDTLGKDSELASTLAQGKPVVAYVPRHSKRQQEDELQSMPLRFVEKRALLLMTEEDLFDESQLRTLWEFITTLADYSPVFRLVGNEDEDFISSHGTKLSTIRKLIAQGQREYLDKRAGALIRSHPLAIQVHLDTGVANGVLVVRSVKDCSKLLANLLTNQTEFTIDQEGGCTVLRERISGCPFRVVTDDPTITNSFWNFYPI